MAETDSNPSQAYAAVRDELIAALAEVDAAAALSTVPSCPAWTVKDVAAHLCGLNAEVIAKVEGRLGSDEATTRQVGSRAQATMTEVLDEWKSHADAIGERLADNEIMATALLADLVIHVYDLAEVLNQPTAEAAQATPISAQRYVPGLQERVAEQAGVALTVNLSDGATSLAEADGTAMTVSTDSHSFLRGVTGRLRRADVEAFDWSSDPTNILDTAWNQYGDFRV